MNFEKITREMVYLCIGEDLEILDKSEIKVEYFHGIKYFIVDSHWNIIKGENSLLCSCNENYCWHIFRVVLYLNDHAI